MIRIEVLPFKMMCSFLMTEFHCEAHELEQLGSILFGEWLVGIHLYLYVITVDLRQYL